MALILLVVLYQLATLACGEPLAPAIYIFGDSLVDSGNNNYLYTYAKANYYPYGANFPYGVTGRFSNGRTVSDFIAEYLKLPYAPPCMSNKNSVTSPITGLNFASASCGILPQTGKVVGNCLSLDDQIRLFEATVSLRLPGYFNNNNDLAEYLADSIYLFSIGSNDYIINYLDPILSGPSTDYSPQQYAQILVNNLSKGIQRVYNLGARKMLVFELGAIGCIPYFTKKYKLQNGVCEEKTNQAISYFNTQLGSMVKNLATSLPGSKFVDVHTFRLTYDGIKNPDKYGLRDTSNPCCTTWSNGTSSCIGLLKPCSNPNQFFFFDAFHPTEAVYSTLASHCISDQSVCSPTISELVKM